MPVMDFSTVCRACLTESELQPMFLGSDDQKRFSAIIYIITGLKVEPNDGLPQKMCTNCLTFINNSLKYRKQWKENEKQLLAWKTELDSANGANITFVEIAVHDQNEPNFQVEKKQIKTEVQVESMTEDCVATKIEGKSDLKNKLLKMEAGKLQKRKSSDVKIEIAEYLEDVDRELDKLSKGLFNDNNSDDEMPLKYFLDRNCVNSDNDRIILFIDEECNEEKPEEISLQDVEPCSRGSGRVSCRLCRRELSARSLPAHYSRAHPSLLLNKIKCELCEKVVTREKMKRHRKLVHGDGAGGVLKCGYCKGEFPSQSILIEHNASCSAKGSKRKATQSGKELRECDVCHKRMQQASLRMHKAVKHAGLGPVCEHCGRRFGNKFRLNEHYRAKHGYEKFKCWRCDFQSAGALAMQNHERRHIGDKPFVCESCGAKFHAAYLLAQHKQSHRTEKLLKCDLCPASFKANNSLHMHKASCHSRAQYKCHVCARAYSCRHYAVKHMRQVHGFEGPVPDLQRLDGDSKSD